MAPEEPPPKRARPNSVEDLALHQDRQGQAAAGKLGAMTLTVKEIAADKLTKIAEDNWSEAAKKKEPKVSFQPDLVKQIYMEELGGSSLNPPSLKRVMLLEISQYLENYLWPNFDAESSSDEHVLSILLMVNEKFRENVPPWACFHSDKDRFEGFINRFLQLKSQYQMKMHEKTMYLLFAINTFQSLEQEMVRSHVLRLVSLPLWHALSPGRLQLELHAHPNLRKLWKKLLKREAKGVKGDKAPANQRPESSFIPALCDEFLEVLQEVSQQLLPTGSGTGEGEQHEVAVSKHHLLYCERFAEFMIDLLSQLRTRRFVRAVLDDRAVLIKCRLSGLFKHPRHGQLFRQLVDLFSFYVSFPIDDSTGDPLSEDSIVTEQYDKLCQLQRLFFKHWSNNPELKELALMNCGHLEKREVIKQSIGRLPHEELRKLVVNQLRLVADHDPWTEQPSFLLEVLMAAYGRRQSQREVINQMPLYPTENILWDEGQIPSVNYTGEGCLALPKLNLQFLTPHDYLLRNFHLFRLEAAYEIREDIADVLKRIGAQYDEDLEKVVFKGWARMAQPIESFKIVEVKKPNVGENKPAGVTAEIVINTKMLRGDVRAEWDELKQHDVLFLLGLQPPADEDMPDADTKGADVGVAERYGLTVVRGCEVIEVKDERGHLMNDFTGRVKPDERKLPEGFLRTLVVALDTAQYQLDMNYMVKNKTDDIYATFNVVMRRKPKENNFKEQEHQNRRQMATLFHFALRLHSHSQVTRTWHWIYSIIHSARLGLYGLLRLKPLCIGHANQMVVRATATELHVTSLRGIVNPPS